MKPAPAMRAAVRSGPIPSSGRTSGRFWVHFLASRSVRNPPFVGVLVDGAVSEYRVERVETISGRPVPIDPGWQLTSVQSLARIPSVPSDLCLAGVAQHAQYTGVRERSRLEELSRSDSGTYAVLIPIAKSEEWWALAQDQRASFMRGSRDFAGHMAIGRDYAPKILRRLYHARYLPGSEWDFLTYFEFDKDGLSSFRRLLSTMRDPARNPEWQFVTREAEIWLRRV